MQIRIKNLVRFFLTFICVYRLVAAQEPDPFLTSEKEISEFYKMTKIAKNESLIWSLRDFIPNKQKHITVVIPSYKNSKWYKKNLDSIFMQEYDNYNIIYIDDVSPDGTADLVEKYIADRGQEHKVTLIRNKERSFALANIYKAVYLCDDDDIIATCDGDDWWCSTQVLATLNKIYQKFDVWVTYGREIMMPTKKVVGNKNKQSVIEKNIFRESQWNYNGLRTFYAWLFKKINKEDFLFQGNFIQACCDGAYIWPCLEMAGPRQLFIPDVFYVSNRATGINNFTSKRPLQIAMANYLRSLKKYSPLSQKNDGQIN